MKLPRRRFWMPLAAVAVFFLCARLDLHYHVMGWLRGDAYYKGMPTCYWRDIATHQLKGPPAWIRWIPWFHGHRANGETPLVFTSNVEARDVLMQLAADRATDLKVRDQAFWTIQGPPLSDEHRAAAQGLLADPEREIRHSAGYLLLRTKTTSEEAQEVLLRDYLDLLRATGNKQRLEGLGGLAALVSYGMEDAKARAHVTKMLDDPDSVVRQSAARLLEILDKERQREP